MRYSELHEGQSSWEDRSSPDPAILKRTNSLFWSGAVDVRDGYIIEVHTHAKAVDADFHHSFYFSPCVLDAMSEGEARFFWIDRGRVQIAWRETTPVPRRIMAALLDQITILDAK